VPLYLPAMWGAQFGGGDSGGVASLAANTTYYLGSLFGVDFSTSDDPPTVVIPFNMTLNRVSGEVLVAGTKGSGENNTLIVRKFSGGSASDAVTVSSTFLVNDAGGRNRYDFSGLSTPFSAGDRVWLKLTMNAALSTAPTLVFWGSNLTFTRS